MGEFDIGEFIRKNYKVLLLMVVIIFVFLMVMIYKTFWTLLPNESKLSVERAKNANFDNLIELFEYYESEYITVVLAEDDGYREQINAKLRLPPVEGTVLNEEFYHSLINDVADYNNYISFIIYDEARDLKVKVKCENGKVSRIIINGIEDYFTVKKREFELRKYKEIKLTELSGVSDFILNVVNNNWDSKQVFGTKESMFNRYDVYFEEGIRVRKIQGKIYNIVFNEKYTQPVVAGLLTDDSNTNVRRRLGTPSFEDVKNNIIGYKTKDFYIFFSRNQISIYRNEEVDVEPVLKLIDRFRTDELTLLEFMNELTYEWPDYNEYEYTPSSVYLSYALKGFEIKINYNNERGIYFYNNFNLPESMLEEYLKTEDYKAFLQSDAVFNIEIQRIKDEAKFSEREEEEIENSFENEFYKIFFDKTENGEIIKTYFVSKDGTRVNRELNDSMNTYGWVSNRYFIYSKTQRGIYCYDVETGNVTTIVTGNDNFVITETRENVFVYDGIEQIIGF